MREGDIRTLCERGLYSGTEINGSLEETHISWVILGSRYVFKIKKPVRLSFLDFSSLEKRKKFCKKEVLLNSRFSDIYLGVVAVRRFQGVLTLGEEEGKLMDYAVMMKRMNSAKRMDHLLRAGKVNHSMMLSLANSVADFHKRAEVIAAPFDDAFARQSFADIESIFPLVAKAFGDKYSRLLARSISWNKDILRTYRKRFQGRVDAGYRRDLHGDLHSRNVFLYKKPVIFDCIEFNDVYRQIDVIDEVAFFCMDLEALAKRRLADVFKKAYARQMSCFETAEDEMIFKYYKCYRANVRAKVNGLAASGETSPSGVEHLLNEVKKYLHLMEEYMD